MSALRVSDVLAGLAVSDLARSVDWYSALLGRGEDDRPMESLTEWHFGDFVLQLVVDPERAGGSIVTFNVGDIDLARTNLASRDLEFQIDESSDKVRFGQLNDPDGNSVTLVQER